MGGVESERNNVVNRKSTEQQNFQCLQALDEFMAKVSWSGREVYKNYGGEIWMGYQHLYFLGYKVHTLRLNANMALPLSYLCLDATCSKACANDRTVI